MPDVWLTTNHKGRSLDVSNQEVGNFDAYSVFKKTLIDMTSLESRLYENRPVAEKYAILEDMRLKLEAI